jgi:hypothetical protein
VVLCKLFSLISRYAKLFLRLLKLKKQGAFVKINLQKQHYNDPDIILCYDDGIYLLRLFNGGGLLRTTHLVSKELAVNYIPIRARVSRKRSLGRGYKSSTVLAKKKRIRPIEYSLSKLNEILPHEKRHRMDEYNVHKVLLFTKDSGEVTALNEKKTAINLLYTGDKAFDYRIFTTETLIPYIERDKRRRDIEKEGYKYFSN